MEKIQQTQTNASAPLKIRTDVRAGLLAGLQGKGSEAISAAWMAT